MEIPPALTTWKHIKDQVPERGVHRDIYRVQRIESAFGFGNGSRGLGQDRINT